MFRLMKWCTLSLALALAATSAEAQIYMWVMPDGTVKYSDRRQERDAEEIKLSPIVTYEPTPVAKKAEAEAPDAGAQEEAGGYDSFTISAPPNDTTVRDNGGNVTINFAVTPSLAEGHAIDLYMDGRKFGQSQLPIVTLPNANRGTHQIYGAIVDASGAEIARTEPITVHLQRTSVAGGGPRP